MVLKASTLERFSKPASTRTCACKIRNMRIAASVSYGQYCRRIFVQIRVDCQSSERLHLWRPLTWLSYLTNAFVFLKPKYLLQIRISRKINITHYAFQKQESAFSSNITELLMLDNSSSQTTHVQ